MNQPVSTVRRSSLRMAIATTLAVGISTTASAAVLEEVVVTATKRAESLQDVSISILAMDGESIRNNAITKMADLTANMPAVTVAQNPIGTLFLFVALAQVLTRALNNRCQFLMTASTWVGISFLERRLWI